MNSFRTDVLTTHLQLKNHTLKISRMLISRCFQIVKWFNKFHSKSAFSSYNKNQKHSLSITELYGILSLREKYFSLAGHAFSVLKSTLKEMRTGKFKWQSDITELIISIYLESNVVTNVADFDLVLIHCADERLHLNDTSGGQGVFTSFLYESTEINNKQINQQNRGQVWLSIFWLRNICLSVLKI